MTEKTIEQKLGKIPEHWLFIGSRDSDYALYPANISASLFQIKGVYETFCRARALLIESYKQEENIFLSSTFLITSLLEYVISWDLSWQVLWFYYGAADEKIIYDKEYYDRQVAKCNVRGLLNKLKSNNAQEMLKLIQARQDNILWKDLRKKCNHCKHRGSFFVKGLGENPQESYFSVNGKRMKVLSRCELDTREYQDKLVCFNHEFVDYFDEIVKFVTPENYNEIMENDAAIQYLLRIGR